MAQSGQEPLWVIHKQYARLLGDAFFGYWMTYKDFNEQEFDYPGVDYEKSLKVSQWFDRGEGLGPVGTMYTAWFESDLMTGIRNAERTLLTNMTKLLGEDLVTGRTFVKPLTRTWIDPPGPSEREPCVDAVNKLIESAQGSSIDLAVSRAALVALRSIGQDVNSYLKLLDQFFNPTEAGQWGPSLLQSKVQIATATSIGDAFRQVILKIFKIFEDSQRERDQKETLWSGAILSPSSKFNQTLLFQNHMKNVLPIVYEVFQSLRASVKGLQLTTQGLQAALMAGELWSLRFAHREWKDALQKLRDVIARASQATLDPTFSRIYPEVGKRICGAIFDNFKSPRECKFWDDTPYSVDSHVVIAYGPYNLTVPGSNSSRTFGFKMSSKEPLSLYADHVEGSGGPIVMALAIPSQQTQGIQFGSIDSGSKKTGWTIEPLEGDDSIIRYSKRVKFGSSFPRGTIPDVQCWVSQCSLDQTRHDKSSSAFIEVKRGDIDNQSFKLEALLYTSERNFTQSFTVNWIAVNAQQCSLPIYCETKKVSMREGTGVKSGYAYFSFPQGLFKEPPKVFCSYASLNWDRSTGLRSWLNPNDNLIDGCRVGLHSAADLNKSRANTVAIIAVGRPL